MELTKRITYLSFIIIGILFVIIGLALDEAGIIARINNLRNTDFDLWYDFLETWVGSDLVSGFFEGMPKPW